MEKNKEFKWEAVGIPKQSDPIAGEIATVNIPVDVLFEWSDKIVADVDEHNNPVEYRSGYIMRVLTPQTFVFDGQERITKSFAAIEVIKNITTDGRK